MDNFHALVVSELGYFLMKGFRQAIVLAVVYQIGTVPTVEDLKFCVLEENLQVLLVVLLALLLN